MKQKILNYAVAFVVTAGALLLSVTDGFSTNGRGNNVDTACAPVTPYAGDCLLCHIDGGSKTEYTPAMDAYDAGGATLTDYFCPAPNTGVSLPASINQRPMGIADFDGDGMTDVLVRNSLNGHWHMYLIVGETITPYKDIELPISLNQELMGIADFNGDFMADLLIRNKLNGRWHVYLMNGSTPTPNIDINLPISLNQELVGLDDSNGDGMADVLLRNKLNGNWNLYLMNGATVLSSLRL